MKHIASILLALALFSCTGKKTDSTTTEAEKPWTPAELRTKATALFAVLPTSIDNPNNPATPEKISLGKMLYYDVRLSKDNKQSCNTCHNLKTFGVDNNAFSLGNDGKPGGRNSPTTLNAAFHSTQFWDGRAADVEDQAGKPILNPVEMAMPSEKEVEKKLAGIKDYVEAFQKAFPADKKPVSYANLQKAIGAFERQLITPSRFDKYLSGDEAALNESERAGLQAFINTGCIQCHTGHGLGGNMFQKFGVYGNYWEATKSAKIDSGRYVVTKQEADKFMFKVPSLRNIEKTNPYFHDGSVTNLKQAIDVMAKVQLNKTLSENETANIIAFLKTLTGTVPESAL